MDITVTAEATPQREIVQEDDLQLGIGQVVYFSDGIPPRSRVMQKDYRAVSAGDGKSLEFNGYTLKMIDDQPREPGWEEWRIMNVPNLGMHFLKATQVLPSHQTSDHVIGAYSGPMRLRREGPHVIKAADVAAARGDMKICKLPDLPEDALYVEVKFSGDAPKASIAVPYYTDNSPL